MKITGKIVGKYISLAASILCLVMFIISLMNNTDVFIWFILLVANVICYISALNKK